MAAMIDYEILVQTIADWKAGVRPTAPIPPAPAGAPESVEELSSGVVDFDEDVGYVSEAAPESDEVDYGEAEHEQPQYDQAQYEQGEYEEPQYDQGQYEQAQYEQAQHEQPQYEQPAETYDEDEQV